MTHAEAIRELRHLANNPHIERLRGTSNRLRAVARHIEDMQLVVRELIRELKVSGAEWIEIRTFVNGGPRTAMVRPDAVKAVKDLGYDAWSYAGTVLYLESGKLHTTEDYEVVCRKLGVKEADD